MNANPSPIENLAQSFTPLYSYHLPPWWKTTEGMCIIGAACIVGIFIIAYGAWYCWWYKPPLTLAQWTEREIIALKTLLVRQPVVYKRFFCAATFFFKQYLVKKYGWKVLDKTDDELWGFIKDKAEIPSKLHHPIQELLSYAQIIKFADTQALAEKAEEANHYLVLITQELTIKLQQP